MKEIEIPEGYEARIVGNKVIILPKESKDERIRKEIIEYLKLHDKGENDYAHTMFSEWFAWLEKQKESVDYANKEYWRGYREGERVILDKYAELEKQKEHTEELPIRMNGLMQEYVKAGKDEEEQEHRLKCYQLFWDALGDSEFFEQKEQKPIPKFKVGDCIYDKRDSYNRNVIREVGKDYYINAFAQKMDMAYTDTNFEFLERLDDDILPNQPAEWSEEDDKKRKCLIKGLEDRMGFNWTTQAYNREQLIEWLKSLRPQSKQEWSEESYLMQTPETYEKEKEAADLRYREEYADGEYCHEQSFKWGFEEGIGWLKEHIEEIITKPGKEDREMIEHIIRILEGIGRLAKPYPVEIKWLKTLLNRFTIQLKQEWNEEDKKAIERAIDCVRAWEIDYCDGDNTISERLKSICPQPKVE